MNVVKDVVIKDVENELNWREKIIIKVFTKTFNKVYNIGRINAINSMLK